MKRKKMSESNNDECSALAQTESATVNANIGDDSSSAPTQTESTTNSASNDDDAGDDGAPAQTGSTTNISANESEGEVEVAEDDVNDGATDYEEECVICLENLSSEPWGRCTPCNHAFHKRCWWGWENAHNERVDRQGRRSGDEGPKCCLCNTVNKQFVDGTGIPANNPTPFIFASDDSGGEGGNRFSRFFREVSEEASGFMDFLQSEFRETLGESGPLPFPRGFSNRNRNGNAERRRGRTTRSSTASSSNSNASSSRNRSSSFVPPFFGSRSSSSASPGRNGSIPPFGVPPFFRNRTSPQRTWSYSSGNPFNIMRPGTQIVTQNLVNSPHLNSQLGVVVQYQPDTRRYLVELESSVSNFIVNNMQGPVAVKPQNLLQTTNVKIHGLRSQQNLNGKEGRVSAYSRERNRYVVQVDYLLSPTREISIRPTNIHIPNGTCVRLEGLQRTPQWNGKYGTIVGWVEDESGTAGRYEVCLSRQYAVRVKMDNVRL